MVLSALELHKGRSRQTSSAFCLSRTEEENINGLDAALYHGDVLQELDENFHINGPSTYYD